MSVLDKIETEIVDIEKAIKDQDIEMLIRDKRINNKLNSIITTYSHFHSINKADLGQNLFIVLPGLVKNYVKRHIGHYDKIKSPIAHFTDYLNEFLPKRLHDTIYKYKGINFKKMTTFDVNKKPIQSKGSVEDQVEHKIEVKEKIKEDVERLTHRQKLIYQKVFEENKRQKVVADELDVSESTITREKRKILDKISYLS